MNTRRRQASLSRNRPEDDVIIPAPAPQAAPEAEADAPDSDTSVEVVNPGPGSDCGSDGSPVRAEQPPPPGDPAEDAGGNREVVRVNECFDVYFPDLTLDMVRNARRTPELRDQFEDFHLMVKKFFLETFFEVICASAIYLVVFLIYYADIKLCTGVPAGMDSTEFIDNTTITETVLTKLNGLLRVEPMYTTYDNVGYVLLGALILFKFSCMANCFYYSAHEDIFKGHPPHSCHIICRSFLNPAIAVSLVSMIGAAWIPKIVLLLNYPYSFMTLETIRVANMNCQEIFGNSIKFLSFFHRMVRCTHYYFMGRYYATKFKISASSWLFHNVLHAFLEYILWHALAYVIQFNFLTIGLYFIQDLLVKKAAIFYYIGESCLEPNGA